MKYFMVLTLFVGLSSAYEYFFGRCGKQPPGMLDFDINQFLGLWYVSESWDKDDECMTWEFVNGTSPNTWNLNEKKESGAYHAVGLDNFNTGTLTFDDFRGNTTGTMWIKWYMSVAGSAAFTVVDTDYLTYAAVYECLNAGLFSKASGFVLSRTPQLKVQFKQMSRIRTRNIKVEYYKNVRQGNCAYRKQLESEEADEDLADTYHGDRHRFGGPFDRTYDYN